MGLSFWHIMVVVLVVAVLFGAGKIPRLAKDLGSGVNAFKRGLREADETPQRPVASRDE
ncbi:MAG: twin-arginine translocase TatA/TatE family subunit [Alphaproteobacteria bacterium]